MDELALTTVQKPSIIFACKGKKVSALRSSEWERAAHVSYSL
jgi:hypothetical protein